MKSLQVCKSCQKYAEAIKLLLPASCIDLFESECCQCIDLKDVVTGEEISIFRLTFPQKRCSEYKTQCIKRVPMILKSDREEVNK